ncbi:hypothetical protein [Amycolatopsis speibonae]|uniref:Uncharacterized protein n=1 Tax=Amycolatopsis speibonae TaxID=1450224 RepID=A0ABV7NX40_9PSEU
MAEDSGWRTLPDGRRIKLRNKGTGAAVAAAAVIVVGVASGGMGALGGLGGGSTAPALESNLAGDVVDSLPGRSLKTRKAEAQNSAKRGKTDEALSRFKLKRLDRQVKHEIECVASSTGKVREFLVRTPCTSLHRMLMAVGDGHGNAAVVSVVRVGFRSKKQATAFERVKAVHGSGDIRPLEIAAMLGLANVRISGLHYSPRPEGHGMVVAETDTAAGHVDSATLDALADVAVYLPVR